MTIFALCRDLLRLLLLLSAFPIWAQADPGKQTSAYPQEANDRAQETAWRSSWEEGPFLPGRLGYVDRTGALRVRLRYAPEGSRHAAWVVLAHDVRDFQIMDERIAVRKTDGSLWFAKGQLSQALAEVGQNVAAYQLTWVGLGILDADGAVKVIENDGSVRAIAGRVKAFQILHTGRIAVLDTEGALWLAFEGSQPLGRGLIKIAENVRRFQLEREWVALVTKDKNTPLLLAKAETADKFSFFRVGSNIADFEMEITVELRGNFPGRVHIAAADADARLLIGEADEPRSLQLARVPGIDGASQVHWANRQLLVNDGTKRLHSAKLNADGTLSEFVSLGSVADFQLSEDPAMLIARDSGTLTLFDAAVVIDSAPSSMPAASPDQYRPGAPDTAAQRTVEVTTFRVDGLQLGGEQMLVTTSYSQKARAMTETSALGISSRLGLALARRSVAGTH